MKARNVKAILDSAEAKCNFSLYRVSRFLQPSILLFLSRGASHGYELIDKLRELGFHKESVDVGAVYRTLRKLEKEGFVKSEWVKRARRRKRVYRITPSGKTLCRMWIKRIKERKRALEKFLDLCKYTRI